MINLNPDNWGVEVTTKTCGISGRIWLDFDECLAARNWLDKNLDRLLADKAARGELDRLEKIKELQDKLAKLVRT